MKLQESIDILEYHQQWRLGKNDEMLNPKVISEAIETILNHLKNENTGSIERLKEFKTSVWNEAIRAAHERNKQGFEIMSLLKRLE